MAQAVTQTALSEMLAGLKRDGRKQLTILLLGTAPLLKVPHYLPAATDVL